MSSRLAVGNTLPRVVRRAAAMSCAVLVASLALTLTATAADDPARQKAMTDAQIEALTGDLYETDAALSSAYRALQETQSQIPGAEAALAQAQANEAAAVTEEQRARTALEVAQAKEERAREELARTTEAITASREDVARFAAQIYQEQGGMGELAIAMEATTPQEFADRLVLVDTVMDVQQGQISRLNTAKADQAAQEALLEALREEKQQAQAAAQAALERASAARAVADSAKQQLDALAAQQRSQADALEAEKAKTQADLAAAEAEQKRLEAQLAEIARQAKLKAEREAKAERERLAAAAKAQADRDARARASRSSSGSAPAPAPAPAPAAPPAPSSVLTSPCPNGCWISSEFGQRFHPILQRWQLHAGRDYAGNTGTRIVAAADGRIISAGWAGGSGNMIMIDHGLHRGVSLVTVYKHLDGFAVRGGTVRKGQVIGYLGSTGLSTGPHLHFETYEDGTPRDPRRWL
ncbi:MAG: peptidoglycan DD-metalloendopeptidase family protein [Intrasporangiaceae bacterium]|nr:peptidoglycan DD-metalloendopeptidase family protein [Intrasporangiaceae bacterium]